MVERERGRDRSYLPSSQWLLGLRPGAAGLALLLAGCTTAQINGRSDKLDRSIEGTDAARSAPVGASGTSAGSTNASGSAAAAGSVSFRRRMPAGADVVRPGIEDGAMQLRVGEDFTPRRSVSDAMPYHWAASCDMFYFVAAHIPSWNPPADPLSHFSFDDACTLNEAGQAFRRSDFNDPMRRTPQPPLTTSFGVSDMIQRWRPVYQQRRSELASFHGDHYFFVGVTSMDVKPYDPTKQGFRIALDLDMGYSWGKPIVLVGKQLSNQRYVVQLRTDEALARLIDESRSSNAKMPAQRVLVGFRLNSVRSTSSRFEIDVTLEKVQISVYRTSSAPPVVIDAI